MNKTKDVSTVAGNQYGMTVRHKDGRIGVIVPDYFSLCRGNQAMVNWDGSRDAESVDLGDLEGLSVIVPKANLRKCNSCVFVYIGSDRKESCCRYNSMRRWVVLYGDGKEDRIGNRLPDRIYPACQLPIPAAASS